MQGAPPPGRLTASLRILLEKVLYQDFPNPLRRINGCATSDMEVKEQLKESIGPRSPVPCPPHSESTSLLISLYFSSLKTFIFFLYTLHDFVARENFNTCTQYCAPQTAAH